MRGANVDTVPGGLQDALLAHAPEPVRDALRRGRAREALHALESSPDGETPLWRLVAEHAALWLLPDDAALPPFDAVDPRPEPLAWPEPGAAGDVLRPDVVALARLCAGMRDARAALPPHMDLSVTRDPGGPYRRAAAVVDGYIMDWLPDQPELDGHIGLLVADLYARSGDREDDAWARLDAVLDLFAETERWVSAAAAWLVRGDWLCCPFGSPTAWGLSLAGPQSETSALAYRNWIEQQPPRDEVAAREAYDQAEALYRRAGSTRGAAHVAWRRSYLLFARGDPAAAAERAREASALLRAAGDDGAALTAVTHATIADLVSGVVPDTAAMVGPIADWANGPGSRSHAIGLGRLYARTGDRLAATAWSCELGLAASEIAEGVWAALDRPLARVQTLVDQSRCLQSLGARRAALVAVEAAIAIAEQPALSPERSLVVGPLMIQVDLAGRVLDLATDIDDLDAIDRAKHRLARFDAVLRAPANHTVPGMDVLVEAKLKRLADQVDDVDTHLTRAVRARDAADTDTARREFRAAERAARKQGFGLATSWLAVVRMRERRFAEAARLARRSLRQRLSLNDSLRWQRSATGGQILRRALLRFAQLRRLEALQLGIAWVYRRSGRMLPGTMAATDASLHKDERDIRAIAFIAGLLTEDYALAREQLDVLKRLNDPWWDGLGKPWNYAGKEGRLLEAEGDLDGALAQFGRAVDAAELVRRQLRRDDLRIAFGGESTVQTAYLDAARVALRQWSQATLDQPRRMAAGWTAVHMLELGRSRALMDLIDAPNTGLPPAVIDAWRGAQAAVGLARDRLAAALDTDDPDAERVRARRADLARAEHELDARNATLRAADPRYWQLAGPRAAESVDLRAATANLPDGEVILVFAIDRPDLVSIVLDCSGVRSGTWSQEERRVGPLAARFVDACSTGHEAWRALAEELGAILLEPHADVLLGARHAWIVASGALLATPFSALRVRGCVLGEHLSIGVLPSVGAYPHLVDRRRTAPALCVGDPEAMTWRRTPDAEPSPLTALPGARRETRAVAALYGVEAMVGPDATEAAVRERLPVAAVVHLATHGLIDPSSPLASSVQLAFGHALTVAEILALRMDADIVVLSACQTGTGTRPDGEEILGLGRALLAAGARSVVVTLWPVDDRATAVLMERLHTNRLMGMSTAQALAKAQRSAKDASLRGVHRAGLRLVTAAQPADHSIITPTDHPMIWAPFVLIGGTSAFAR